MKSHYRTYKLFVASLKILFRNRLNIFATLFFPLLIVTIFGHFDVNNINANVIITERSDTSNFIYQNISANESVTLVKENRFDDLDFALETGRVDAVINITEFSREKIITNIEVSNANPEISRNLVSLLNGIINERNLDLLTNELDKSDPPLILSVDYLTDKEYKPIDDLLPGQIGVALITSGVFTSSMLLFSLRKNGVLKRLSLAPGAKINFLLAEALSKLVLGILQVALILMIGYLLFDYRIENGVEGIFSLLLISMLGLLGFLATGFFISNFSNDEYSVVGLSSLLILPQFIVSGAFFRRDVFPQWIQNLSDILPLTQLVDALRSTSFAGDSLITSADHLVYLATFSAVAFLLSLVTYKTR